MSASPFMEQALAMARSVRGSTSPNPGVGAVFVRDGVVVSRGATEPPPGRHAEAVALAGVDARGADLYVTLEPCAPFAGKRTPPCSDALAAAGVRRVVIALEDPDRGVRGAGIARLRAAGIEVSLGDGAAEALALLRPYIKHRLTGLPYVIAKFAVSLDGKMGAPNVGLRWLTSDAARERAHEDRAWIDAILVGSQTVLHDDPALTARPGGVLAAHQPVRIVLDGSGRVPASAALFRQPGSAIVATTAAAPAAWRKALRAAGAQVLECEDNDRGISLEQLLTVLASRGIVSLIVEGGATVHGSFFDAELVDEVHAYIAPVVVGPAGIQALAGDTVHPMTPERLEHVVVEPLGPDVLVRGFIPRAWSRNLEPAATLKKSAGGF